MRLDFPDIASTRDAVVDTVAWCAGRGLSGPD